MLSSAEPHLRLTVSDTESKLHPPGSWLQGHYINHNQPMTILLLPLEQVCVVRLNTRFLGSAKASKTGPSMIQTFCLRLWPVSNVTCVYSQRLNSGLHNGKPAVSQGMRGMKVYLPQQHSCYSPTLLLTRFDSLGLAHVPKKFDFWVAVLVKADGIHYLYKLLSYFCLINYQSCKQCFPTQFVDMLLPCLLVQNTM